MAVPYERLVAEDLERGYGTVSRTMPAGGTASGEKIGVHSWIDRVFNVADFGARGDGLADDTLAIQAAIDAVPDTGGTVILPANGTYRVGALSIADKSHFTLRGLGATLQLVGTGLQPQNYIGIVLSGTLLNVTIDGLVIVGDAVAANAHAGIAVALNASLTDIVVHGCRITDVTLGIAISNATASTTVGARIIGNYLENIVGESSGQGYGIQSGAGAATAANAVIAHNTIIRAQRHSIYSANGGGVVISSNTIKEHRFGSSTPSSQRPAIEVARSEHVVVANNLIDTPKDGAIEVAPGAAAAQPARNIAIIGNVIMNPTGSQPALVIGSLTPASDNVVDGVLVEGNSFYQTGNNTVQTEIYTGKRISYRNNQHQMLAVTSQSAAIQIRGLSETAGTATYTDDLQFHGNLVYVTNNGGTGFAVDFYQTAATSAIRADFTNNRLITPGNAFSFGTTQTNPNIRTLQTPTSGLDLTLLAGLDGPFVLTGDNVTQGLSSSATNRGFWARYGTDDSFAAFLMFNGLQFGNTADNWIVAGRTSAGASLKFAVNNTTNLGRGTQMSGHNGITAAILNSAGRVGLGPNVPDPATTVWVEDANGGATRAVVKAATSSQGATDIFQVRDASSTVLFEVTAAGRVGISKGSPGTNLAVAGLPAYADNGAAVAGGLTQGDFYRTVAGVVMVVIP